MRVLVPLLCASLSGCYATWDVSHRELARLDGYRAPQMVMLKSTSGDDVAFGPKSHLLTEEHDVRLASASVVNGTFVGVTPSPSPTTAQVRLTGEGTVIVANPSRLLTGLGVAALSVATGVLLMIIVDPRLEYGRESSATP
jgi:acetyltransferase-like isoleucine patch superfamily enzyme